MLRLMSSETRSRGLAFCVVGFGAFVIAAMIAHAVWFYQKQRDIVIDRALTEAQNLANILEEHTRTTVQWADSDVQAFAHDVKDLLSRQPDPAQLPAAVATAARKRPATLSIVYADGRGNIVRGDGRSKASVNIAGEPDFEAARSADGLGIHAIVPPWLAEDHPQADIALVRPVRHADGTFAGVAIGLLEADRFRDVHMPLELGKGSIISVFSTDGILIARAPHLEGFVGTSFADAQIFQELERSRPSGRYYNPQQRDGTARFVAYRAMPDMPFIVAVGRAEEEVLAPLTKSRWTALSYIAALLAVMVAFIVVILTLVRRQGRLNEHLRATLDNINQGVVVFDENMRLVSWNHRYVAEMFEYPPGFIAPGLSYFDILRYLADRGEYPGMTAEDVIRDRTGESPITEEHRIVHRRPNGAVIVIYRKPMAGGGFVITFTDITEDMRIKEEAQERATLLNLVLDSIQQGIRVFDKDLKLVLANRRLVDTFGYPEEFARPGVSYESTVRIGALNGEYGSGDIEKMVADRVAWGHAAVNHGSVRRTPSGRYVKKQRDGIPGRGFVSTYTDVTELVRAEEELAHKSALLQLTLEHMGDGISVYDEHLRLLTFNKRWVEIWDVPESLARPGTSYLDLLHRQVSLGHHGRVANVDDFIARRVDDILSKKFTSAEIKRLDGTTILIRRHAAPNGIVVISHTDITRLKQAETESGRKSALLEAVLDNMAQGMLVCDADMKVIAFNDKFWEIQGFQPGDVHLGMAYEDFLRLAIRCGNIATDDPEAFIAQRVKSIYAREHFRREFQVSNGRHITLRRMPMPDGGFVMTIVDVTDRKKAERALQASEERYRTLVMSSAQLIWSMDVEGNVIEPQPTWQAYTGQSDEEVMGWGWLRPLHPEDNAYVRRNWLMAVETASAASFECRLRRHDGVYRTFKMRAVPLVDQGGAPREWVGICEDISERKQVEAEVAAKSALFEAVLQNMAQGVSVYDSELNLVAYNRRFLELFEFPAGTVAVGQPLEEILWFLARRGDFGPEPEDQVTSRMVAARNRQNHRREFVQSNGRSLFVIHTAMPDGGFINTFTDVTEQRQAERALQDSEKQMRAILDNVADAIITTDRAGLIQSCNAAAVRMFGYAAEEAIGLDIRNLIPDSDLQPRNQRRGGGETLARHRDGKSFPIDIAVTSVTLPGRWLQIAIVRDIGMQKALQAQLLQTSKLATLGEMSAAMAHEMAQPLHVMRMAADNGLARIERQAATMDGLHRVLEVIAGQAERMGKLLFHMRVFSRFDRSEFEPFDPCDSVKAAVELMKRQLRLSNIALTVHVARDRGRVFGRQSQLEQVLINLLSNAQDAVTAHPRTGQGNSIGSIGVSLAVEEGMVRIKVSDTGGGIPAEIKERIFDPFFTTKPASDGTGLGLSISASIVAAMNGTIDVVSTLEGSEFTVLLPLHDSRSVRGDSTAAENSAATRSVRSPG